MGVVVLPFKITDSFCNTLEFLSYGIEDVPNRIFKSEVPKRKKVTPRNLASGIFYGTGNMIRGIFKGISGVITEPIKGLKKSGIKGATLGFSKGILGLVCSPVAGTIKFVTYTVKGANNTPSLFYKGASKILRKRKLRAKEEDDYQKLKGLEYETPASESHAILIEPSDNEEIIVRIEEEPEFAKHIEANLGVRNWVLEKWIQKLLEFLGKESDPSKFLNNQETNQEQGIQLKSYLIELIKEAKVNILKETPDELPSPSEVSIQKLADLISQLGIEAEEHYSIILYDDAESSIEVQELFEEVNEEAFKTEVTKAPSPTKPSPTKPSNPLLGFVKNWRPYGSKDEYRIPEGAKEGGLALLDKEVLDKLRSAAKEMMKVAGRKILKGDFNLTTISFPIKCMKPTTALHNTLSSFSLAPLYMTRAGLVKDPVERMKFAVVTSIASFRYTSSFMKPLNPLLGETLHGTFEDGTQLYCEQTSHHPPISHFHIVGPDELYGINGYVNYSATAGLNSATVLNSGKKCFWFPDGTKIVSNFPKESFSNTFWGTLRHETLGTMNFSDEEHNLECYIKFAPYKKKPSDYIEGMIVENNKTIKSKITGTYLGYIDFDGIRYWDIREISPYKMDFVSDLPSSGDNREDLTLLNCGDEDGAQRAKEELEKAQRKDAVLRSGG